MYINKSSLVDVAVPDILCEREIMLSGDPKSCPFKMLPINNVNLTTVLPFPQKGPRAEKVNKTSQLNV